MRDVTNLLSAITQGGPQAAADLLPLVYDELRRLGSQWLAQAAPGQTLQPTAHTPPARAGVGRLLAAVRLGGTAQGPAPKGIPSAGHCCPSSQIRQLRKSDNSV